MKASMKSLGKTSSKLLLTLSENDKNIFTIPDAQEILESSPVAIRNLLNDLAEKKWIIRLVPGKYLIVPLSAGEESEFSENWYVVAKYLIDSAPYYLSHYSALDIHEMTTQPLMTVVVSTIKRKRGREILGAEYRFIFLNPSKYWGVEEAWVKPTESVKVSDLERTIVDCLDNPGLCGGVSEIAKGMWIKRNEIDYKRLLKYVDRFGSRAVAKRLGFLLGLYDIGDDTAEKLRRNVAPSYVSLDPSLPEQGKYLSTWKLRINLNPDELKEIIKT